MTNKLGSRNILNKDKILDAAMKLVAETGIKALSMRKLAQTIGVGTMSLYNHIANKDELLDGMLDRVLSEIEAPRDLVDWRQAMRVRALSARQVFSEHRWAVELMGASQGLGIAQVKYANSVLRCLREAGFPPAASLKISSVIDSYVYGFFQKEQTRPFKTTEELVGVAQSALLKDAAKDYPYVIEAMQDLIAHPSMYDIDKDFVFGLDIILTALGETVFS